MNKVLEEHSKELREALALANMKDFHEQVAKVAQQLKEAFAAEKTVYVAGNGGSAAEAQHLSDEFLGRYRSDRRAYPVVALTADMAAITCIANDYGYEQVFARQVEALGKPGDVFIGLSTSGNSENLLKAFEVARGKGMTLIAITGRQGKMREQADYVIESPADKASIVQEFHLHAIHLICEIFEP